MLKKNTMRYLHANATSTLILVADVYLPTIHHLGMMYDSSLLMSKLEGMMGSLINYLHLGFSKYNHTNDAFLFAYRVNRYDTPL